MTTVETARMPSGLTPNQRVLFAQMTRAGFLVENGFQLLADDNLESEEWKESFMPEQISTPSPIEPWRICDQGG